MNFLNSKMFCSVRRPLYTRLHSATSQSVKLDKSQMNQKKTVIIDLVDSDCEVTEVTEVWNETPEQKPQEMTAQKPREVTASEKLKMLRKVMQMYESWITKFTYSVQTPYLLTKRASVAL